MGATQPGHDPHLPIEAGTQERSARSLWSDERLESLATQLAQGKPVPSWIRDGRGIVFRDVQPEAFQDPALMSSLLYHGFEPGGTSIDMYFCNRVIKPGDVKVQRRTLKRLLGENAEHFTLRVDSDWERVVRLVQEHTWTNFPGDCWLSDELGAYMKAARESREAVLRKTAFHSVELWFKNDLIAANIGYTIGWIYSGITKFYLRTEPQYSGAGIMMTSALAAWLHRQGFQVYAMGSDASYKREGVLQDSYLLDGMQWLEQIRNARDTEQSPSIRPTEDAPVYVKELVTCLQRSG